MRYGRSLTLMTFLALGGCAGGAQRPTPVAPAAATPIAAEEAVAVFDTAWARIDRSYYDTTFHGVDWAGVRDELRPLAREAGTVDSLRAILGDMISRLGDSHFAIIPASTADALDPDSLVGAGREPGSAGLDVRVVDDALVVTTVQTDGPAAEAGVRPGWVIDAIDGRPASGLLDLLDELADQRRLAEARAAWVTEARLGGAVGDTVEVRFIDGAGAPVETTLVTARRRGTPVRFGNLPTQFAALESREITTDRGCAGLIAFNVWMTPILPEFEDAFRELRHCDGMILDLRGNPGGVGGMVMAVSGYFLDERKPLGRMLTRESELSMVSMPRRVTRDGKAMKPYEGPVALLVDGQSMSTSEIFAEGMQGIGRARVFGVVTGGQALPALMSRLPNRDVLMHAFANFVGPDGTRIEGRGVVPDQVVPRTRSDLLQGIDAPLDAALAWIEGQGDSR